MKIGPFNFSLPQAKKVARDAIASGVAVGGVSMSEVLPSDSDSTLALLYAVVNLVNVVVRFWNRR